MYESGCRCDFCVDGARKRSRQTTERKQRWREANPERNTASRQRYYRENRDRFIAEGKQRYAADPEKIKAQSRAWKAANPERTRELARQGRARHRIAIREQARNRAKEKYWADPEAARAKQRAYRATKKGQSITRNANLRRRALPFDEMSEEWVSILLGDPCSYCGARPVEIDHIEPISLGGDGGWENLCPACRTCNASKNDVRLLSYLDRKAA